MAIDPRRAERRRHINPRLGSDLPMDASQFAARRKGAKSLTVALDDGYPEIDRWELVNKEILIERWEIRPGYGGRDYATVWVMFQDGDDVTKCKFKDGGSDIVEALTDAMKNGTRGDIYVKFVAEEYGFESPGGPFLKYGFTDPDGENVESDTQESDRNQDEPDF